MAPLTWMSSPGTYPDRATVQSAMTDPEPQHPPRDLYLQSSILTWNNTLYIIILCIKLLLTRVLLCPYIWF